MHKYSKNTNTELIKIMNDLTKKHENQKEIILQKLKEYQNELSELDAIEKEYKIVAEEMKKRYEE